MRRRGFIGGVLLVVLLLGVIAAFAAYQSGLGQHSSTQGASQTQGIQGERGPVGFRGDQGLQGTVGASGVAGGRGTNGAAGKTGNDGQSGAQGPQGDQGPAGQSTCANGSSCVALQGSDPTLQTGNISISGTASASTISTNRVYQRPHKLMIYYGIPQGVNNAYNDDVAAQTFSRWDYVVFGTGLEDPGHTYHASTQAIIGKMHTLNANTKVFGYIDIGVTTGNLSIATMQAQIDQWKATGADHIFLDVAGYDFHVSRARLNTILDYIHSKGMAAMVNAFNPDDVMGSSVDVTYNPSGIATHMNSSDFYLLESWIVNTGAYTSHNGYAIMSDIKTRGDKIIGYRSSLGVKMVTISSVDFSSYSDEQTNTYFQMTQAASIIFSLDGYGLSAYNYSSVSPNVNAVKAFEYDSNYPNYYNPTTPYIINGPWTQLSRPDTGYTFYDDFGTNTFWYSSAQTNILKVVTIDTVNNNVGIGTVSPGARLHVQSADATTPTLIVQAVSGQTADLLSVRDSGGGTLVKVDSAGSVTINGPGLSLGGNIRAVNSAITQSTTTLSVSFAAAYPSANYGVICTPNYATTCYVTNQTTNGFTLNFGTAAPAGATVSWLAIR